MPSSIEITSKQTLLTLPPEILHRICHYLPKPAQGYLSQTCKTLEGQILPRLYRDVHLKIPEELSDRQPLGLQSLEGLIYSPRGLKYTTGIVVSVAHHLKRDHRRTNDYSITKYQPWVPHGIGGQIIRIDAPVSISLNVLMRMLLRHLPKNRLRYFHWNHSALLDGSSLTTLCQGQGDSLIDLRLHNTAVHWNDFALISGKLQSLHLGSQRPEGTWTGGLLSRCADSIRDLKIGVELALIRGYGPYGARPYRDNTYEAGDEKNCGFTESIGVSFEEGYHHSGKKLKKELGLQSVELIGLDLTYVPCNLTMSIRSSGFVGEEDFYFRLFEWEGIRSLSLKSCDGIQALLTSLASIFGNCPPKLTTFSIRADKVDRVAAFDGEPPLGIALDSFLRSFSGLEHLQVLFEAKLVLPPLDCFIGTHGDTLKTVVWDSRIGPRTKISTITSTSQRDRANLGVSALAGICNGCPGLEELGVSIDWKVSNFTKGELRSIKGMKFLKTLNIRNLPAVKNYHYYNLPADQPHKSIASNIVDELHEWYLSTWKKQSPLSLLCLGSLTYNDIYFNRNGIRSEHIDIFLQPRYYKIRRSRNKKKVKVRVSEIGRGSPEGFEYVFDHLRIFEPYWLQ